MQPNNTLDSELVANEALFTDSFFQQFTLRKNKQPLQLNETISKDYQFPTFYGNVTCAIGVFLCDYQQAQQLLPHPKMKPVAMPKGRALVTFSCYEYQNVMGIAPYNEIAMTIPVMVDPAINIPVLPMVMDGFSKFGYYVFHMPVTSLENRIRGNKIWGLPKVVDTVDIKVEDGISKTRATDEQGNFYFSLEVPTQGKPTHFDVRSNLYSRLDQDLLQSPTQFKGDFNVIKYMDRLWKRGGADPGVLKIGEGPYGDMLKKLKIEPQPFQFRYAHHMNACFDLPNENYQAPFTFTG
ncbi:acetoacetate decarboxylase family protein [Thalassomonas sp. RHCl1]|uniref:acetoacetate decarboxylase family protein n=1 Tax=Thalassomonas sp. RHCl1 TaxID=2995320 RepID=UPI00248BBA57|nr:acetoacetate decarboxylase family protein [Thalassomonas sp. RHCl1]